MRRLGMMTHSAVGSRFCSEQPEAAWCVCLANQPAVVGETWCVSHLCRLHELDPALSAARLPRAVHLLVPQLGAEQDTARFAAMQVRGSRRGGGPTSPTLHASSTAEVT